MPVLNARKIDRHACPSNKSNIREFGATVWIHPNLLQTCDIMGQAWRVIQSQSPTTRLGFINLHGILRRWQQPRGKTTKVQYQDEQLRGTERTMTL